MTQIQDLNLKQLQNLALTPEMRQSLSVLQMSCTELSEFLNQELMENPLLEIDENARHQTEFEDIQHISWTSYIESCGSGNRSGSRTDKNDEEAYTFEKYAHTDMNYHEVLDLQFGMLKKKLTPRQIRIGNALLDKINDDGYLFADLEDMAVTLNVYPDEIESVLMMIQKFYPSGTGARSVEECLFLQLKEAGTIPEEYETLLFSHLEDLAEGRTKKIEQLTGIGCRIQLEFLNKLKNLHPRPGSQFAGSEKVHYVVPDGSIDWVGGTLHVKLNTVGTPPLLINPVYQKMLSDDSLSDQCREYITERMNRALTLLHNIEARENTIQTIASVIAEKQKDYLLSKSNTLKPLTQKQIAKETGFHESTVSRTIRGKYFLTPRGTLELKALFCAGYESDGATITVDAVKDRIRTLIQDEDPAHPLTDQRLADLLSEENLKIARRTVAKYREELGIKTASKRRALRD